MRLTSIAANCHVFDGRVNGRPLRLLLTFDNGRTVRLAVAGDGYRMLVDNLPLDKPSDMEGFGSVTLEDMTDGLDVRLQNAEVQDLRALELGGQRVGVQLLIVAGDAFHFWVDGDELFWGDEAAFSAHDWLDGQQPAPAAPVQV